MQTSANRTVDVSVYVDIPAEVLGTIPAQAAHVSVGLQQSARLVDMPPNELHTATFADEALLVAQRLGCGFQIFRGEQLREMGLGGLYGTLICAKPMNL